MFGILAMYFVNCPQGWFRLSVGQTVCGFCVGMLAMCFIAGGVYLVDDYGHPFWGRLCIGFGVYLMLSPIGLYFNFILCRWLWWFL